MNQAVSTSNAPSAIGPYSQAIRSGSTIYVSGQLPIDPATGAPAQSGLTSVTVVADSAQGNGTMCDALSTALFVMGEDRALEFWRSGTYDFQLVLVTEDGRVVVTDGLREDFVELEESGYTYEFVS